MDKENLQPESKGVKIFDTELAKEIISSDEFKKELVRKLQTEAENNPKYSTYASIVRDLALSDITGEYKRRMKKYLYVRYTLRGKQELLKRVPPGVYPIIYKKTEKNKTETWIAVNTGQKLYAVVIINLDEKIDAKFPSIFNVAFLVVNPNDVEYLEVELDNKSFPVYAKCGENCHWMPEKVFEIIKNIVSENVEKKLYEERQLKSQWTEEKEQPKEKDEHLENLFYRQVEKNLEIVYCKWNEYVQNAYLLPNISYGNNYGYSYCVVDRFIRGSVLFIPKPIFLPKQIYIKDPDEIRQIPEGIYPIIRFCKSYKPAKLRPEEINKRLVFAISPNTEVVFEINYLTEDVFKDTYKLKRFKPLNEWIDFAIVWNNNIIRRNILDNILDFDDDFRPEIKLLDSQFRYSSSYWNIWKKDDNEDMYYMPEVLFLFLVGENVKPREEPFVAELILNSQKNRQEWSNWVKSIANKYNNIKVDNENLRVIGLTDLHEMYGAWYVKEIKKHFSKPYELDYYELVIINMREEEKVFKLKTDFDWKLREDDVGRVFITIWPDGSIGRWILDVEGY